jgi:hypothetical protein
MTIRALTTTQLEHLIDDLDGQFADFVATWQDLSTRHAPALLSPAESFVRDAMELRRRASRELDRRGGEKVSIYLQ